MGGANYCFLVSYEFSGRYSTPIPRIRFTEMPKADSHARMSMTDKVWMTPTHLIIRVRDHRQATGLMSAAA